MPVLQRSDRPSPEQLLSRLRELQRRVPDEARRFHEAVRDLIGRTEEARGRRFPWTRGDELEQRAEEVGRLEQAVPHFAALFTQVDGARRKLQSLRLRSGKVKHPVEIAWLEPRCLQWEAVLEAQGAMLPRESELARARGTVAEIEAAVDLHDDTVMWLEKARQVLRGLAEHGLEVEGATLEADLPEVTETFRTEGPSRKGLDDLAAKVRKLEERLSSQPREAPREYGDAARVLDRVEEWHRALQPLDQVCREDAEAVATLRNRLDTALRMWRRRDPEDADAVLVEARALLEGTAEGARRRRAGALQDLRQQVRYLSQLAGSTEAAEELAELERRSVDAPRDHGLWWAELERTRTGFLSEAENEREELAGRLTERGRELAAVLGQLSATPMGVEDRAGLFHLESGLRELGRSEEPRDVLRDLQRLDRLQEEAAILRARVAEACARLEARRAAARERLEGLLKEAERAGVLDGDLGHRYQDRSDPDAASSLEETEAAVRALEGQADRGERELVETCRRAAEDAARGVERILRALAAAGRPDAIAAPPELSPEAGVKETADAVARARNRLAALEAAAEAAWKELAERRAGLLARIEDLGFDSLRPGDRDRARQLAEDLSAGPWDEAASPADRIELLLPVVARGDELFAHLAGEEDEARLRLAALRARFDRAKAEGLHDACGELADRVEALLRGVPENPVRWSPVLRQLERAEGLLGRLEIHARRLAGAELAEALALLEERRQRGEEPEAERLVAELADLDPHELPPLPLRRRITRLARTGAAAPRRRSHG